MQLGPNALFCGDLGILRNGIGDESVDLIYLDPLFNSNASYSAIFNGPANGRPPERIEAFGDAWRWNAEAKGAFDQVASVGSGHAGAAAMLCAMRFVLQESDMMAYLAMMAVRLLEMHRVLKAAALYLHCDPMASHYLKILLDAIFGPSGFRNEVIWKRLNPKSHVSCGRAGAAPVRRRVSGSGCRGSQSSGREVSRLVTRSLYSLCRASRITSRQVSSST
jgi:site-specific DNA-methyltransferase (adenine-specific)